jgi:hypothetical protein
VKKKVAHKKKAEKPGIGESGYIVVETIGTFIPFVFLVISILSLVNIVALQARVHYALTQAAGTLSMYCYVLEVIGISNDLMALDSKADKVAREANALRDDIMGVLSGIESLSEIESTVEHGTNAVNRMYGWGEEAVADPNTALQNLINFGIAQMWDQLFELLARPLVGRYLSNGDMTGDEYLRSVGVVSTQTATTKHGLEALDFFRISNLGLGNSSLIDKNGNVKLVAQYEIEYTFGGLPLPFRPTLRITQTVVTKAWLNGSGKGYW